MIPLADFSLYNVALSIHILGVVLAVGFTMSYPIWYAFATKEGISTQAFYHRVQARLDRTVVIPAMVVILAAGLYMAIDSETMDEPWVSIPFTILIIEFALGGAFFSPTASKLGAMADAGDTSSEGYRKLEKRVVKVGTVALLLWIVAIVVMSTKPTF